MKPKKPDPAGGPRRRTRYQARSRKLPAGRERRAAGVVFERLHVPLEAPRCARARPDGRGRPAGGPPRPELHIQSRAWRRRRCWSDPSAWHRARCSSIGLPDLGDPGAGAGAGRQHARPPAAGAGAAAPGRSRSSMRVRSAMRQGVAVGLVHDHRVRELDHALLDALELVAAPGREEHEEEVDHGGHRHLGLPDAHGLDQHDVVARRLAEQHRLAGALGDAAQRAARGRRPDEGLVAAGRAAPCGSCRRGCCRR